MTTRRTIHTAWLARGVFALALALAPVAAGAQHHMPGPQHHMGGRDMQDPEHRADMALFLYLLDHGDMIQRTVTTLPDGVETVTESDDAEVAAKIREHVAAMYRRVEDNRPIHARDPLFREIFSHADAIDMKMEPTDKGIRVVERSDDPYVATLIKAHAEVVNRFIANGRAEMMRDHAVPAPTGGVGTVPDRR